jgi:prepilin-type N-terminal cleavage/methylation domain-containing protein
MSRPVPVHPTHPWWSLEWFVLNGKVMQCRVHPQAAFTLMELMIVVAIIALLAVMAFPSFQNARLKSQQNACMNNLRQISHGKDRYALDKLGTAPSSISHLVPHFIHRTPTCPARGTYTIRALGIDPTCSRGATLAHTI